MDYIKQKIIDNKTKTFYKLYPLFDIDNYKLFNKDLQFESNYQYLCHYHTNGIHENRIYSKDQLLQIYNELSKNVNQQNLTLNKKYNKKEQPINILIRTSNRKTYFETCIASVINQNYKNYKIICCYDDLTSLNYLSKYNFEFFHISYGNNKKHKYNLYLNDLMAKVSNGWIIILDDDDCFTNNNCLAFINEHLDDANNIYLWQYFRPDKIIFPIDINNINYGEIASCSFCFNNDQKNKGKFDDDEGSDFRFFKQLLQYHKIETINNVLTKTVYNNHVKSYGQQYCQSLN
jgi:hypothetical protein